MKKIHKSWAEKELWALMIWLCFKEQSPMTRVSNGSNSEQHKLEFLSLEVELQLEDVLILTPCSA